MTMETLAATINGREYREEITKEEAVAAKAAGLVICYGASDDLVEFDGAISDEFGGYDGKTFRVVATGLAPEWDDVDHEDEDECEAYFKAKSLPSYEIAVAWYPWVITTDLPHATFEIAEDGELFCRGIVFELPVGELPL